MSATSSKNDHAFTDMQHRVDYLEHAIGQVKSHHARFEQLQAREMRKLQLERIREDNDALRRALDEEDEAASLALEDEQRSGQMAMVQIEQEYQNHLGHLALAMDAVHMDMNTLCGSGTADANWRGGRDKALEEMNVDAAIRVQTAEDVVVAGYSYTEREIERYRMRLRAEREQSRCHERDQLEELRRRLNWFSREGSTRLQHSMPTTNNKAPPGGEMAGKQAKVQKQNATPVMKMIDLLRRDLANLEEMADELRGTSNQVRE
mmetsp:Transcript_29708/g.65403  ORF Transcript_29708/g.65403 Transcript_29708/m.65403 type:complete len:263 (-) Transcript_29708:59-847(-)